MGMYRDTGPVGDGGSRELDQGDVLRNVLLPKLPHDRAFGFQRQTSQKGDAPRWVWKPNFTAEELLAQEGKELRVMSRLERVPYALVLSNSCDNYAGDGPILLAPIRPFEYYDSPAISLRRVLTEVVNALVPRCGEDGCSNPAVLRRDGTEQPICEDCAVKRGSSTPVLHAEKIKAAIAHAAPDERQVQLRDAEMWMTISRAATGANPKRFYMAGDPTRGFERSEAHLVLAQPVEPAYLTRCLKELNASRTFGLGDEAIRHLQYTVQSFFGRNPRDDIAWPSREDLQLKSVWLTLALDRPGLEDTIRADYEKQLREIAQVLEQAT
jgi:hypothetical protein